MKCTPDGANYYTTEQEQPFLELLSKAKNKFNGVPLSNVYKFFLNLTKVKDKKKECILSEEGVQNFIRRAFLRELEVAKPTLNSWLVESLIIGLFHRFYTQCSDHKSMHGAYDCKPHLTHGEYAKLLYEHFTNYENKDLAAVLSNFKKHDRWNNTNL